MKRIFNGGLVAVAMVAICLSSTADAGGLFKKRCGGGFLAKLKSRKASSCCAPAPSCCEPAPAPSCCEPAPEPCGCSTPAPEPCGCGTPAVMTAAPVASDCGCGSAAPAVMTAAPVASDCGCGGAVVSTPPMMTGTPTAVADTSGYNLAPGEQLVPGSVQTVETPAAAATPAAEAAASEPAAEAAPPAPTPDAAPSSPSDAVEEAAPPAPTPDAATSEDK